MSFPDGGSQSYLRLRTFFLQPFDLCLIFCLETLESRVGFLFGLQTVFRHLIDEHLAFFGQLSSERDKWSHESKAFIGLNLLVAEIRIHGFYSSLVLPEFAQFASTSRRLPSIAKQDKNTHE